MLNLAYDIHCFQPALCTTHSAGEVPSSTRTPLTVLRTERNTPDVLTIHSTSA